MKPLLYLAASTLALTTLTACASGEPAQRAKLECPATQGELTRTGVAADGKSCTYVTQGGAEVSLQLVSTGGDPQGALQRIEAGLTPAMTDAEREAAAKAAETAAVATPAAEGSASDAASVARQAEADAARAADTAVRAEEKAGGRSRSATATIDIGDDKVDIAADNDKAHVRLPGIRIDADGDNAKVQVGGITIDANDGEATIRRYDTARLRGESLSFEKRGIKAMFIRTGEFAGGYRVVGYEAGGPKTGPITVATVRSKTELDHQGGDLYDDIKRLVRKNSGV
ncbi:hypothetical protein [Phenylobacterium sp. J367]|uniref:hypothetical protein n=1 Tax=Phenylobacterium sp. J367 TaxID=2898435 RepID=UPI0021514097|nr:hypothetical protein [Phenylobacterium sp. J367]MCR5880021.1 hypothetical protein [Phenylobacterium sp. J367]